MSPDNTNIKKKNSRQKSRNIVNRCICSKAKFLWFQSEGILSTFPRRIIGVLLCLLRLIPHIFLWKFVLCLSRLDLGMCYGCPLCSSLSPEVPALEFCLPPVCCHSDWTRWRLRRWCVGELCDTSLISSFDPLIDWLQEQRINRAQKSRFHSPLWSGLDKVQRPGLSAPPLHQLYGHPAVGGGYVPW